MQCSTHMAEADRRLGQRCMARRMLRLHRLSPNQFVWSINWQARRIPAPNESKNPMARVRCITEMGMGVDVHGKDSTKAAKRAVSDAIRHSSLGFFRMLGKTAKDMFVDVTIAVPDPTSVDTAAVARELPYGTVTVIAVKGGLEVAAETGGDAIIIANAAVIVSLDDGASS